MSPASVKSCHGCSESDRCGGKSPLNWDSVEVSELIVQTGVEAGIDLRIAAASHRRSGMRRPAASGQHDHDEAEGAQPVRQHPRERVEAGIARYREDSFPVF